MQNEGRLCSEFLQYSSPLTSLLFFVHSIRVYYGRYDVLHSLHRNPTNVSQVSEGIITIVVITGQMKTVLFTHLFFAAVSFHSL